MAPRLVNTDFPLSVFSVEADRDYLLARHTSFLGGGFHSRAGFFGQQAIEKYMKALMVQERRQYVQSHKLLELAAISTEINPYFGEPNTLRALKVFDYFEQVGRYGAAANFDPMATQTEEFETAGVMVWKEAYLQELDAFVFKTRSFLDFAAVNFDDLLRSIQTGNRRSLLLGTWQGRPPLRVILTKNNLFFRPA